MGGFFTVRDIPEKRVVRYVRVNSEVPGVIYLDDESVLGAAIDEMPFVDKTGIKIGYAGITYEVPYRSDAGGVYFVTQPSDLDITDKPAGDLIASPKAGKAPYKIQWYKDDKQVVNVPDSGEKLKVSEEGLYWATVEDADGGSAVSKAAKVYKRTKE